jgi:hypothetical protein
MEQAWLVSLRLLRPFHPALTPSPCHMLSADRTLSLLCNAAISRGTPHNLVANLAQLSMRHYNRNRLTEWKHIPTLPPSPKNDKERCSAIDATAWDDLEAVVRLAERRDSVLLGRLRPHKPNRPIRRHLMYMRKWKLQ